MDIYKNSHGFLLFFDVTNQNSIKYIKDNVEQIQNISNGSLIIVANKIDVKEARIISKSGGQNFANNLNCEYYECSGISGINVYEIFNKIISLSYYVFKQNILRTDSFSIKIDKKKSSTKGCC